MDDGGGGRWVPIGSLVISQVGVDSAERVHNNVEHSDERLEDGQLGRVDQLADGEAAGAGSVRTVAGHRSWPCDW